jgi:hypothetical protein
MPWKQKKRHLVATRDIRVKVQQQGSLIMTINNVHKIIYNEQID